MEALKRIVLVMLIVAELTSITAISFDTKLDDDTCYTPCGTVEIPCKDDHRRPPLCELTCKCCGYRSGSCTPDGVDCCCRK
ncbi:hypothetical protein ACET3Z_009596 [Daucus carota]